MDTETQKQLYFLDMKKACAQMEHANQCAARDLSRGEWMCNWTEVFDRACVDFEHARTFLNLNFTN